MAALQSNGRGAVSEWQLHDDKCVRRAREIPLLTFELVAHSLLPSLTIHPVTNHCYQLQLSPSANIFIPADREFRPSSFIELLVSGPSTSQTLLNRVKFRLKWKIQIFSSRRVSLSSFEISLLKCYRTFVRTVYCVWNQIYVEYFTWHTSKPWNI